MEAQLKSACEALKVNRGEVMKKKKGALLAAGTTVQMLVQFADNQQLPEKITTHRLTLPAPMFNLETTDACLITRPPQRKVKDTLRTANFPHRIERVVDIRKLRRKFKSYAEREKLHKSYTLFLADRTIVEELPDILGRDFMYKAKMPVSVSVPYKPDALKDSLAQGFNTAQFHVARKSLETTVGIGNTDQEESALAQNGLAVIEYLKSVPELASNIRSIRLKTQHSPALLVYQNENIVSKESKGENKKRKREETEVQTSTQPAATGHDDTAAAAPAARKQKGADGKVVPAVAQPKKEETTQKATPVKPEEKAHAPTPVKEQPAVKKVAAAKPSPKAAKPAVTPVAAAPAPKQKPPQAAGGPAKATPKAGKPAAKAATSTKAAAPSPRSGSGGSVGSTGKPSGKAAWK